MKMLASLTLSLALGLSCAVPASAAETPAPAAAALGVTTPSGLSYFVTKKGNGRLPKVGESVFAHYTVLFTDGRKLESSLERGEPFSASYGEGGVIKGMDEAMGKLGVGDQAVLIIPPHLAYGDKGAGKDVPPGTTLVFLLHVTDIRAKDKVLSNVLFELVMNQGLDAALKRYADLKAIQFGDVYTGEGDMEALGNKLSRKKKFPEAIAMLRLNIEAHPKSAYAYASLGEILMKSGDKVQALQVCKQALALDPKNKDALELLGELQTPQK